MYVDLLDQTVTVANKTGRNSEGQPTYGAGTQVNARVQETSKRFMKGNGMEVQARLMIFLPSTATVDTDDKITYESNDYYVIEKRTRRNGDGSVHHIEAYV